jgi:hypothetical protein
MPVKRRKPLTAHVGVMAVGHHTYWQQFDGLLKELNCSANLTFLLARSSDTACR